MTLFTYLFLFLRGVGWGPMLSYFMMHEADIILFYCETICRFMKLVTSGLNELYPVNRKEANTFCVATYRFSK
jgi:hypothetical protein